MDRHRPCLRSSTSRRSERGLGQHSSSTRWCRGNSLDGISRCGMIWMRRLVDLMCIILLVFILRPSARRRMLRKGRHPSTFFMFVRTLMCTSLLMWSVQEKKRPLSCSGPVCSQGSTRFPYHRRVVQPNIPQTHHGRRGRSISGYIDGTFHHF